MAAGGRVPAGGERLLNHAAWDTFAAMGVVCVLAWWRSVYRDLGDGGAGALLVDDGLACRPGGVEHPAI